MILQRSRNRRAVATPASKTQRPNSNGKCRSRNGYNIKVEMWSQDTVHNSILLDFHIADQGVVDLNSPALIEISQLLAIRQLGKTMGLEDVAEAEDANKGPGWPIFRLEKMGHWWWWTRSVQSPLSKWTGMRPCLSKVRARKTSMPPLWHVRSCTGALDARQPGALHPIQ